MSRIAALALALALPGCAEPWTTARGAITAAEAAIEALPADSVPAENREGLGRARAAAAEALDLGRLACDVWQREADRSGPPTGWAKWIADALTAAAEIVSIVKAAGVDLPPALAAAVAALQLLLPLLGGSP